MGKAGFSVIITTYNRVTLVGRAIRSALMQEFSDLEIIVVDDASTDATPEFVSKEYPQVRYFRQTSNQGPQSARNRGIQEATQHWIVILDDDDELLPGTLERIAEHLQNLTESNRYPVVQFACSNGFAPAPFIIVHPEHYLCGRLLGDFTPIIQREKFIAERLAYPVIEKLSGVGVEHLLWWKVAARYGIPTWSEVVVRVNHDAPVRLTSSSTTIERATSFARMQEVTLSFMREIGWDTDYPDYYALKQLGSATYWMVAGDCEQARTHLKHIRPWRHFLTKFGLWGLSFLPLSAVRWVFHSYKQSMRAH